MYEIKKEKDALREKYGELRRSLDPEIKAKRDAAICAAATSLVSFRHADTVLLFAPKADEIDIRAIAQEAWARGKEVAFPLCDPENRNMTYHIVSSFDELRPGTYGIMEPSPDSPIFDENRPAVCFIPALLFDAEGYRVGYGKGYYDRFLHRFTGSKIGLVYSDFLLSRVPRGRFDLSVDIMVTEKGVRVSK